MRIALIILTLCAATASATPQEELDAAKAAYRRGNYQKALPLFNALLYPPPPRVSGELAEVYLALGVCRFETGDHAGASREFEQSLSLNPNAKIDPLIVTDPAVLRAFDDTKLAIKKRLEDEAARKRKADLAKLRASLIGFEQHSFVLNFIPFGIGQFQNHQSTKGVLLAASQGLALLCSVSIWGYLVNRYGIRSDRVPLEEGPQVRLLQQVEIGSGVLFFGLWIAGVVDSLRNYTPQTRAAIDDRLLPPELRDPDAKTTSYLRHITPLWIPSGGAGIGLVWGY
jgi:tetratricopeptide (TPR) repeat protein